MTKRESPSLERMCRLLEDWEERRHFIEFDMRQAEGLQDVDHWRHLVVVPARKSGWGEDAVASSWPLPPVERRFVTTVTPADGLL